MNPTPSLSPRHSLPRLPRAAQSQTHAANPRGAASTVASPRASRSRVESSRRSAASSSRIAPLAESAVSMKSRATRRSAICRSTADRLGATDRPSVRRQHFRARRRVIRARIIDNVPKSGCWCSHPRTHRITPSRVHTATLRYAPPALAIADYNRSAFASLHVLPGTAPTRSFRGRAVWSHPSHYASRAPKWRNRIRLTPPPSSAGFELGQKLWWKDTGHLPRSAIYARTCPRASSEVPKSGRLKD